MNRYAREIAAQNYLPERFERIQGVLMSISEVRTRARVEMHMMGGFTRLILDSSGKLPIEVKTEDLPADSRELGSWVVAVFKYGRTTDGKEKIAAIVIEPDSRESPQRNLLRNHLPPTV